jgi:hypothetical protein
MKIWIHLDLKVANFAMCKFLKGELFDECHSSSSINACLMNKIVSKLCSLQGCCIQEHSYLTKAIWLSRSLVHREIAI